MLSEVCEGVIMGRVVKEDELRRAIQQLLMHVGTAILQDASDILDSENITYTGSLKRSGYVEPMSDGRVKVGYKVPYAWFVNYGRGPGRVPFDPIFRWVVSKLGETDLKRAKSKAWAIVKKIRRIGTEPTLFLNRAVERVLRRLRLR